MFYQVIPEAVVLPSYFRRNPCVDEAAFRMRPHPLQSFVTQFDSTGNPFKQAMDTWAKSSGLYPCTGSCSWSADSTKRKRKSNNTPLAEFDFHEFLPEEIKVKVTEKNIQVHGRHQDESSFYEVRKSVPLPEDISKTDIVCRYENGLVRLEQPDGKSGKLKKLAESTTKAVEDKSGERKEKKEECELSDKREPLEKLKKNLNNINSMFFGFPFLHHIERKNGKKNEEKRQEQEEKEELKGEKEKVEEQSTVGDNCDQADDNSNDEQICVMEKCDESEHDLNELGSVNPKSIDSVQVEKQTNDESLEMRDHSDEVSQAHPNFKVELDLSKFEPDNVRVVVGDRQVMVSGEREIKGDNYFEVEKWSRCIKLPEGVDESKLSSIVDKDGKMTIQAPYHTEKGEATQDIPVEVSD